MGFNAPPAPYTRDRFNDDCNWTLKEPARRVHERQLAAFKPAERKRFLQVLDKFTRTFNESTRVPLEAYRAQTGDAKMRR